jgi:uncharacterized membrane protein YfcA
MSGLVVSVVALGATALTLFSGFGLGTQLLPAFALVFPVEVAVAATAVVHLANNLFKLALLGRHADRRVVLRFGLPALCGAAAGAWLLTALADLPALARFSAGARAFTVTGPKLAIGMLIVVFALIELSPRAERWSVAPRWLPAGGLLSGFCGGLSGHQGALRSAFLLQVGLDKRAFIGTGVACAVLVDLARLAVYGFAFAAATSALRDPAVARLVALATGCAFAGALLGVRLLGKVTLSAVRRLVGALLILLGAAMIAGVL